MPGFYLTHPQVMIDAGVPVPDWSLSERGRERLLAILDRPWLRSVRRIVSSPERKAQESATLLAGQIGLAVEIAQATGENDRSSTGILPPDAFEAAADRFFAEPASSWQGWERACDACQRIVGAVDALLADHPGKEPILIVGHGAVGTLLKCHLAGRAIARKEDQPAGGGNVFAFGLAERRLLRDWTPMEDFTWPWMNG